ncbi:MAG: Ig-like domain-containing protein, partial [Cyanobacteria bacterium]|nr:Ig-like domain-containing protein [Cyanobacteriota bacterium]
ISAALAAGETLRVFNGSTLLGSATVNNTAKTWSYIPTLPASAGTTYNITARVADVAGNLGIASAARKFVLDTTAPATTVAISAVSDNVGLIKGVVAAGARTDDTTPTIAGTTGTALAAGETLRIFNGSTLLGSAAVNNTAKTWSFAPTLPASAGTNYNITARVADAAGNLAPASAARAFVLDTGVESTVSFALGPNQSTLKLTGTKRINGTGNGLDNTIVGNPANNRIAGLGGKDILTGSNTADRDVFVFFQLSDSLLLDPTSGTGGYFDEITDFNRNDRITAPFSVETDILTSSLGEAETISPTTIAAVLTTSSFTANGVAAFTANSHSGTFIAMNDARAGFQADTDSIVWLRDYSISAANFVEFV